MSLKSLKGDQILVCFPKELRELIHTLLKTTLCLTPKPIKITPQVLQDKNGLISTDKFSLEISYAGINLNWEVLFSLSNLKFAPDFYFGNDSFLENPEIDVIAKEIPSLAHWNPENKNALVSVLREFLDLYKKHQLLKLELDSKFVTHCKEYKELLESAEIDKDDVEIQIEANTIHYLIAIRVDCSELPIFQGIPSSVDKQCLNPGDDVALVKLTFTTNGRIFANLTLSARLEQQLGNSQTLHLPTFNKKIGLSSYITNIKGLIDGRIEEIKKQFHLKNAFISNVLNDQRGIVLEYDNLEFNNISLLLKVEEFYVLVQILLGIKFPIEPPSIMFRSNYHEIHYKPLQCSIEGYPYSPRWSATKMVQQIFVHIVEEIPKFQQLCQNQELSTNLKD